MTSHLIRVVIIEDQPHVRNDVQILIGQQKGFVVVGSAGTVEEGKQIITNQAPDLLLLDIHLPDGTSFDLLQQISPGYKIIFLTAFEKHAIQAVKIGALDYLLKPVDEGELITALQKAVHFFPPESEQLAVARQVHSGVRKRLVLRSQDFLQIIEISEIVFLHSDAGYTTFYLSDGRKILVSKILKEYEDLLPPAMFLRTHQSYLVNGSFIDQYRKEGFIILKNGTEIPVATRRKDMVLEYLNQL